MNNKQMQLLVAVWLLLGAAIAVERFYVHPTFGRGVSALLAVVRVAAAL